MCIGHVNITEIQKNCNSIILSIFVGYQPNCSHVVGFQADQNVH